MTFWMTVLAAVVSAVIIAVIARYYWPQLFSMPSSEASQ